MPVFSTRGRTNLQDLNRDELRAKAARIRLVATDIDGVWTDGGMYYSEGGDELKRFNTRDGVAVSLLRQAGLEVAIITRERTAIVERRAAKVGVSLVFQGVENKGATIDELAHTLGIAGDEIAYIGDDIYDLPAMKRSGFTACVADGVPQVRAVADYVTQKPGGAGAFREFAETLLELRGTGSQGSEQA